MATETKKRMRETKGAGLARVCAVCLQGVAVFLHVVGAVLTIFENGAQSMATALMDTLATEDK